MADANAGTLSVTITGDISGLLDALSKAESASEAAGEAIATALGASSDSGAAQAVEAIGAAAEQASGQMDLFAAAAQQAGEAEQQLALFDVNSIEAADEAFGSLAQSIPAVGEASKEVAPELQNAGDSAKNAGESAGESSINWEKLLEQLIKFAEYAGIGFGIEELASEALHAFAAAQSLEAAFEFIGGSAQAAASQVQQLRDMAMNVAVPFNELAAAAQKMAPALGGFAQTLPLLQAAADDAKVMGLNFETVAGAMDRMVLSGTLMGRMLQQLGISLQNVADSMGVTESEAKKLFLEDDVTTRIQILIDATSQYAGASKEMLGTLASEWTDFRNTLDFTFDDIGKALAPLASAILEFAGGILSSLRPAFQAIGAILGDLTPVLTEVSDAVKGLADVFGGDVLVAIVGLTAKFVGLQEAVQVAGAAVAGWELGKWLYDNSSAFKTFGDSVADAIVGIDQWLNKNQELARINAAMGDVFAKEKLAIEDEAAAINNLQNKLAQHGIVIQQGAMSMDQFAQALRDAAAAMPGVSTGFDGIGAAGQKVIDQQSKLREAVQQAKNAVAELKIELDAAIPGTETFAAAQENYNRALENLQKAEAAATPALKKIKDNIKDVSDELTRDGDQLASIEDKMGPALKRFQEDIDAGMDPTKIQSSLVQIEHQFDDFISKVQNSAAGATEAGKNLVAAAQAQRDAIATIVNDADVNALPLVAAKTSSAMQVELAAFNDFAMKVPTTFNSIGDGIRMLIVEQTLYDDAIQKLPLDGGANRFTPLLNPIGKLNDEFKALGMTIGEDLTTKLSKFTEAFIFGLNEANLTVSQLQDGFTKVLGEVTKFPELAGKLLPVLQQAIDEMTQMHGISLQILNDQVSLDAAAMKAAIDNGQSAQYVLALAENLNTATIKANAFKDASAGLATLYQNVTKEFSAAWTAFGTGIGDAIVGAQSFSQAFDNALSALEKKLAELVTNYLLGMLKDALLTNTSLVDDFNKVFNSVFGVGGEVAKGLTATQSGIQSAGQAMTSMLDDEGNVIQQTMSKVTEGVNQVGNAAMSSLSSIFNLVTSALTAIASIISAFELAHIEKQLSTIEGETRRTANALENGVVNQLLDADQHLQNIDGWLEGPMYQVMVSMSSDLDSISGDIHALLGLAVTGGFGGGGGGGGGTSQAFAQLTSQLNSANTVIQELRQELAQLGSTTASTTSSVGSFSSAISTTTPPVVSLGVASTASATALNNLATFTENSAAKMGDLSAAVAVAASVFVAAEEYASKTGSPFGPFASTPPNYTYTPGSASQTQTPNAWNYPGSPWMNNPNMTGMPGQGNLQINVTSPSAQTTAQQIVQALRNNAGLKL